MSTPIYHVPDDTETGLTPENSKRRAQFLRACAICKQDYEVRDGNWLPMISKKGTEIRIKVCDECYRKETE
jgi:hypothetical protein